MATIREGIYLEQNRPVRSQWRTHRRDPLKPVQVAHTAESGIDLTGSDGKAEAVANFIRYRTDAGSYHLLGDRDSILQLIGFGNEAYGDRTGSNRWAIHWSLAMDAAAWPKLSDVHVGEYLQTAVQMALIGADYTRRYIDAMPEPRRLTLAESNRATASGFIDHGRRDPGRRSDPGAGFPWEAFLADYDDGRERLARGVPLADVLDWAPNEPVTIPDPGEDEWVVHVKRAQTALQGRGRYLGHPVDGLFGPASAAAVEALAESERILSNGIEGAKNAKAEAHVVAGRIEAEA